jgi:hypothetical protein
MTSASGLLNVKLSWIFYDNVVVSTTLQYLITTLTVRAKTLEIWTSTALLFHTIKKQPLAVPSPPVTL